MVCASTNVRGVFKDVSISIGGGVCVARACCLSTLPAVGGLNQPRPILSTCTSKDVEEDRPCLLTACRSFCRGGDPLCVQQQASPHASLLQWYTFFLLPRRDSVSFAAACRRRGAAPACFSQRRAVLCDCFPEQFQVRLFFCLKPSVWRVLRALLYVASHAVGEIILIVVTG